jgi:hypothetical protein
VGGGPPEVVANLGRLETTWGAGWDLISHGPTVVSFQDRHVWGRPQRVLTLRFPSERLCHTTRALGWQAVEGDVVAFMPNVLGDPGGMYGWAMPLRLADVDTPAVVIHTTALL